jgi:hypothetical protein
MTDKELIEQLNYKYCNTTYYDNLSSQARAIAFLGWAIFQAARILAWAYLNKPEKSK